MLNYTLITPPAIEPVTLTQAHAQLRLDAGYTADDTFITGLITAAREVAEKYTRRAFFNQTWVLSLDAFPAWNFRNGTVNPSERKGWPFYSTYWDPLAIRLPKPRCVRVISITYLDLTNTLQTLSPSAYAVDVTSEPARIVPMPGTTWPTTQLYLPGSVQVTFEAASYGQQINETFTVPASPGPYTYTLLQTPQTAVDTIVDGEGNVITGWSNSSGVLTFPATSAGATYTATYYVPQCPQSIQSAILLLVDHFYENQLPVVGQVLSEVPMSTKFLLDFHLFEQFTLESGY